MKLDVWIVIIKGWSLVTSAGAQSISASLAHMHVATFLGVPANEFIMLSNTYGVMMVTLYGFLSGSFTDFISKHNNPPPPPPLPDNH